MSVRKVRPFLWFNGNALAAAEYYVSLFQNSKITNRMPGPGGEPMGVEFTLDGQQIVAFNGGSKYPLTPAVSLYVDCDDQAEVDRLWTALTADGGQESQCGWLVDRFGLSWQIIPSILPILLSGANRDGATRAIQAMLTMQRIDIESLQRAYDGQ